MPDLSDRINAALANEEIRAERFAGRVRMILLVLLTVIALANVPVVGATSNMFNFGALATCYAYGFVVFLRIRGAGYRPVMKYITSCLDIFLVVCLLFLYTRIEIPSVALKNYVFLIVFPLLALTAFRYDRMLTLVAGGMALGLYLCLVLYLVVTQQVILTPGGYERELFTSDVTFIGQGTKVLILAVFVVLMAYLVQYSRTLFHKLVSSELGLRDMQEETEHELTLASQVQSQFLPRSLPAVRWLEMYGTVQEGRFVGGDYYDFVRLDSNRLLVISADVSGKGVPAALIMAEVRGSTHLLASMKISLVDLLQRLNVVVYQSTEKKSFVTFSAVEINARSGTLRYVIAGHPPPIKVVGDNVEPLMKGTIPLGICPRLPQLKTHSLKFPPGSMLVSYTDGLVEHRSAEGEEFGEERLREFTRSHACDDAEPFTQTLLDRVRDFGGGKAPEDDMSVAVVKYTRSQKPDVRRQRSATLDRRAMKR
jgi:hypothetical protein